TLRSAWTSVSALAQIPWRQGGGHGGWGVSSACSDCSWRHLHIIRSRSCCLTLCFAGVDHFRSHISCSCLASDARTFAQADTYEHGCGGALSYRQAPRQHPPPV